MFFYVHPCTKQHTWGNLFDLVWSSARFYKLFYDTSSQSHILYWQVTSATTTGVSPASVLLKVHWLVGPYSEQLSSFDFWRFLRITEQLRVPAASQRLAGMMRGLQEASPPPHDITGEKKTNKNISKCGYTPACSPRIFWFGLSPTRKSYTATGDAAPRSSLKVSLRQPRFAASSASTQRVEPARRGAVSQFQQTHRNQ